ncbi:MAG: AraC family transcriptional regulator [Bacteroidales bacterium]|nr:AraC family transcriptional regulator [Bacteroidales bacterium]
MYSTFRIPIPEEFQDTFSHFYYAENKSDEAIKKTLIPSFHTLLVFSFGNKVSFTTRQNTEIEAGKYIILGPVKQAFDYTLYPESALLVLNLKEDAFYRYFGESAAMENSLIYPDELVDGDCFAILWSELNRMKDVTAMTDHILEFSKPYLRDRDEIIEQLSATQNEKLNPIKSVAERNNLSERTIQIHHKKQLGYSSKELNRYKRFIKTLRIIQEKVTRNSPIDWFKIITECGYYDQSQLIHDFKQYMNLTPTQYLKFMEDICNPVN